MTRACALMSVVGLCLLSASATAEKVAAGHGGKTFTFNARHAPFPDGAHRDKDSTVVAFVPDTLKAALRASPSAALDVVVFFHGHENKATRVVRRHRLREMLVESGKRAILVVPQLADNRRESHGGKLQRKGGLKRLLDEVVDRLTRATLLPEGRVVGRVILVGHSGGFQPAAYAAVRGGADVREVYLLDALYGFSPMFVRWLRQSTRGRLVSYSRGGRKVSKWTAMLRRLLDKYEVAYLAEPTQQELTTAQWRTARVLLLRTELPHADLPHADDTLRELLKVSCLEGGE